MSQHVPRIRWSQKEQDALVEAAAKRLIDDPGVFPWKAIDAVQKLVLPADRRRPVLSAKWLRPGTEEAVVRRVEELKRAASSVSEAEYHKVIEERDSLRRQVSELMSGMAALREQVNYYESLPKPPTEMQVVQGFIANIVRMAHEAVPSVPAAPAVTQPAQAEHHGRHDPFPESDEGGKGPKIVVVGLLPRQQNELADAINGRARLRFWKDGSLAQLESMARNADRTFLAVDWIDHKTEQMVRSATENFEKFKGGAPRAKTAIEGWLSRSAA